MFKWCAVFLMLCGCPFLSNGAEAGRGTRPACPPDQVGCTLAGRGTRPACPPADAALPDRAEGTFVQRKTLADVEVTITSKGVFRFEKGKSFTWETREPMASTFVATPTNYAMTVNGKTTTRALKNDVTSIAKIFEIKEVKDFVKRVVVQPETGFPTRVDVFFKNGDKLEIEMVRK